MSGRRRFTGHFADEFKKFKREYIEREYQRAGCSVSKMAKSTGLNRQHIYKMAAEVGLSLRVTNAGGYVPRKEGNEEWQRMGA